MCQTFFYFHCFFLFCLEFQFKIPTLTGNCPTFVFYERSVVFTEKRTTSSSYSFLIACENSYRSSFHLNPSEVWSARYTLLLVIALKIGFVNGIYLCKLQLLKLNFIKYNNLHIIIYKYGVLQRLNQVFFYLLINKLCKWQEKKKNGC